MEDGSGSGLRRVRRWRVLLAHEATAATCDLLIEAIEGALGNVDIAESSSVEDARSVTQTTRSGPSAGGCGAPSAGACGFDVVMVCLDLPPAPIGGVRLAEELVRRGLPVILVTRSLRWVPAGAVALRGLPWIPPDADVDEVARAIREAIASVVAAQHVEGDGGAPRRVADSFH